MSQSRRSGAPVTVLGLSGLFHDSAAALVTDGRIVAAAQEERFTRIRHDPSFPEQALAFCLNRGEVEPGDLDAIVYHEQPLTAFGRQLVTSVRTAPRGFGQFRRAMPSWLGHKVWIRYHIEQALHRVGHPTDLPVLFSGHHESHASSAFLPSPFSSAAVLTFDGVGEWATMSIARGNGTEIEPLRQQHFPDSIGLLYSMFTQHCGFRVDSGESKLMGLAPYGKPSYVERILSELVDLREDGSFTLDRRFLGYLSGTRMTTRAFDRLFDGPALAVDKTPGRREMDLARSIQLVTEEIVLRVGYHAAELTGERSACLAGGVALNCVANRRLLDEGPFDEIWVQPAAGDAGAALGAALRGWYELSGGERAGSPAMAWREHSWDLRSDPTRCRHGSKRPTGRSNASVMREPEPIASPISWPADRWSPDVRVAWNSVPACSETVRSWPTPGTRACGIGSIARSRGVKTSDPSLPSCSPSTPTSGSTSLPTRRT